MTMAANTEAQAVSSNNRNIAWFTSMNRELPTYFKTILAFSFVSNLLLLVSPLYMLQVYDRILTSGSTDTLIWLTLIAVFLLAIYGATEVGKRRLCALAAEEVDAKFSERVFRHFDAEPASGGELPQRLMVISRVRGFFQNQTLLPFLDLPFAPLFLILMFVIHPVIGAIGFVGGAILLGLAILAEFKARDVNKRAAAVSSQAFELASGLARQRSAMVAMGLASNALERWREAKLVARELNLEAGEREGRYSAATRSGRQILQILILGAGASLAIAQEISPGTIVAGSIIMARALAPIDQIVGSWRSVAQARDAWERLEESVADEEEHAFTALPRPEAELAMDRLSVAAPGANAPLIHPFGIVLSKGQVVSIVGQNGSGKTTLLQTVAGVWPALTGSVHLGKRDVHDWPNVDRGQYVGYVPQNVELLAGSVAQNIARMQAEPDAEEVITAARQAGAHEMILQLPNGYETQVGSLAGDSLSAGQRQLIGLARALYGDPVLLLLDEPSANLDEASARQVALSLQAAADRGVIILVATHDRELIGGSDKVLAIQKGAVSIAKASEYIAFVKGEQTTRKSSKLGVVK